MRTTWTFHTAGKFVFGIGAASRLGEIVRQQSIQRLFMVCDQNLIAAGLVDQVKEFLDLNHEQIELFDEGEAEPSIKIAERAIRQASVFQPDGVLGLGGGSNMDLAKVTAAVCAHGGTASSYFGFDRIPGPVLPLICVPTTAGTGSEVSHSAVLTDTENEIKVSMQSNHLRPRVAVVDPQLMLSCPRQATADSGIDALTHAIEACTAIDFDNLDVPTGEVSAYEGRYPLGECLAEKSIELIGQHLVKAVKEPQSLPDRSAMALAASLAGMAFSNCGVALVHALEYPLGGVLHCSHGAGNGLLLPFVMQFNLPVREKTFARIAERLGLDVTRLTQREAAQAAIDHIAELRHTIGVPTRLRELGATEEQIPLFAEKADAIKRLQWINPRPVTRADLIEILTAAF